MKWSLPQIHPDRCTGCGRCVAVCPEHVLSLHSRHPFGIGDKKAVLDAPDVCTRCTLCVPACPFVAVSMQKIRLNG